jgi:streptogramin lyase
MTPTGEVTQHEVLQYSEPRGIALGPEGDLWFAEVNNPECSSECHSKVGRINPVTDAVAEFSAGITAGSQPWDMATGPDGNLWFSERTGPVGFAGQMARINPTTDEVKQFSAGITGDTEPDGVAAGPDGNVWFTEEAGNRIGRITPGGTITEFPIPSANSQPVAIVTGPDGNLWFAEQDTTALGRITASGAITEFPLPSPDGQPRAIAAGPDGNLWFAEQWPTATSDELRRQGWSRPAPRESAAPSMDSQRAPVKACGSPSTTKAGSGRSRRRATAWHPTAP